MPGDKLQKAVQLYNDNGKIDASNKLQVDATVTVSSVSLDSITTSGNDLYTTTNNVADGSWTITFDSVSGLDLASMQTVENKTQGFSYKLKGATITATSIVLVSGNQESGVIAPVVTDELEIVYRGISRQDTANTSLASIDADTATIAGDTTSLDAKEGTTGEAAAPDGTRAAQLRYIGEAVDGLEGGIVDTPFSAHATVTTAGTAVQATSNAKQGYIFIRALSTNTGYIYVGDSGVTNANGWTLGPEEAISMSNNDLSEIYIDSSVNGEGVEILGAYKN